MIEVTQAAADPASSPQVRTLLLTDLCDSTLIVERLGDGPAAELFRAHDRLVLELQQRWRGRLIDRSDGLLLLFERPVDGLGFALDYARGLRELGERPELLQKKLSLQARAGLHVGEVLTWHNSEAAVQAGAKPLEVEGLAKPLAGRLMTLARPGQILLSSTAEAIARRASRELGERSDHLLWKSHGRWRFKGVPDGQDIYEVGEPGFAPLRAPKHGGKAWRDIPLWRRPAALAAEMMLVVGIGTGAWFLTRPTPAIAFNERDWVVVGDVRNLTGQTVLDASLEQAFRISLEQSRYVNVLSELKVRDTLERMKRKPETVVDRAIASEIAIRDGARAVILPTVAEVGGRLRVSAEVVDPHTQTTVYAESADGVGASSALNSIDEVTGELREKLGEAIAAIERDSQPLPQVSTGNLDALRAYALGEAKYSSGDVVAALQYFQRALELDPQFALARVAIGRVQVGQGRLEEGRRNFEAAAAMRGHLTAREQLSLQTLIARFGPVPELLARWQQLTEMYPDMYGARMGYAQDAWMMANRYAEALPHARAATAQQNPQGAASHYLQGMLLLGQEHPADAIEAFKRSRAAGFQGGGFAYSFAYEVQGQRRAADALFASRGGTSLYRSVEGLEYRLMTGVDRGEWTAVGRVLSDAMPLVKADPMNLQPLWRMWSANVDVITGNRATDALRTQLAWVDENASRLDAVRSTSSADQRLAIAYLAARSGDATLLADAMAKLGDAHKLDAYPMAVQAYQLALAERDRLAGAPMKAADRLRPLARSDDALIAVHASLARALGDTGVHRAAALEWEWVAAHPGRAFVERGHGGLLDPLNVADTTLAHLEAAEQWAKQGDAKRAKTHLATFRKAWQASDLPPLLAKRAQALTTL